MIGDSESSALNLNFADHWEFEVVMTFDVAVSVTMLSIVLHTRWFIA